MSNEYERLKQFAPYWEGKTMNELFQPWVMVRFPPSKIVPQHCLVCLTEMSPEHIWPDGLTPRCMCDSCFNREIVSRINTHCFVTGQPLPPEKIEAQKSWARHVPDNILDGAPRDYYTFIANVIYGSLYATGEVRPDPQTQNALPPSIQRALPPPQPRMTVDDMFNQSPGQKEYANVVNEMFRTQHHDGEDFGSWRNRQAKETFDNFRRDIEVERQGMAELVNRIERDEPHLVEKVCNFDGSLVHTRYNKNGHVYVKMPNGHIHEVS